MFKESLRDFVGRVRIEEENRKQYLCTNAKHTCDLCILCFAHSCLKGSHRVG